MLDMSLPSVSESYERVSGSALVTHGLRTYFSSCWGPLRTSKSQRAGNKRWATKALTLWVQEFGMNLILMGLVAGLLHTLASPSLALTVLIAAITPPVLVVVQMFVDASREDTLILRDVKRSAGLTVRLTPQHTWSFFNHFGLPIGGKAGVHLRHYLHAQARTEAQLVSCYAQNEPVAKYYLTEIPGERVEASRRPLLYWDYSGGTRPSPGLAASPLWKTLLGINNTRSAGQLPRGKRNA